MKKIKYIFIFIALISFSNCDDFLDIPLPSNQFFDDQIFSQDRTIATAINGVLAEISTDGTLSYLDSQTSMYTDNITLNNNYGNIGLEPMYLNELSGNYAAEQTYTKMYWSIFQTNALIEGITASTSTLANKDQYLGESYFLRAFSFYNLTNIYGDIALPLTSNTDFNNRLSRSPQSEVFAAIIEDLKIAVEKLPETHVTSDGEQTSQKGRPNKATAKALLAKVYLYTKNWQGAADLCTEILSEVSTPSLIPLQDVFVKDSEAIIWTFEPNNEIAVSYYSSVVDRYIYRTEWYGDFTYAKGYISQSLINSFETDDQRLTEWVEQYEAYGYDYYWNAEYIGTYPLPNKYKSDVRGEESLAIFRMADIYLTHSEALANLDDLGGAVTALNVVRTRAGLSGSTATGKEAILDAILKERRVEFFSEMSSRFFDLKRMGKIDEVMNAEALVKEGTVNWQSYKQNWPIPNSELLSNPNLDQTTGY